MDFVVSIIAVGGTLALVGGALEARRKQQVERTRLLEEAIRNNADRHVIEALAWSVSGKQPPTPPAPRQRNGVGMAILLAIGWLTLFVGIGISALGAMVGSDDAVAAGVLVSIIGFGLVTYPFALRELESRRAPQ